MVWVASFGEEDSKDNKQHRGDFFAWNGGNNNQETNIDAEVVTTKG